MRYLFQACMSKWTYAKFLPRNSGFSKVIKINYDNNESWTLSVTDVGLNDAVEFLSHSFKYIYEKYCDKYDFLEPSLCIKMIEDKSIHLTIFMKEKEKDDE